MVVDLFFQEKKGRKLYFIPVLKKGKRSLQSFGTKTGDYEQIRQSVCAWAERAAEKLRQDRRYCRMISVWLHGYGQKGYTDSWYLHRTVTLRYPVQDTRDIIRAAVNLLDTIWCDNVSTVIVELCSVHSVNPVSVSLIYLMRNVRQRTVKNS
ncbi:hypothetical protein [Morganella morganii]|uniref:DinB/UmuC family translesion DNA polymerase n=1 Tax=Morganella morganii TaxID=582 RepID=UPI003D7C50B7